MRFLQPWRVANGAKIVLSSCSPLQCFVRDFSTSKSVWEDEGRKWNFTQKEEEPRLLRLPRAALDSHMYSSHVTNTRSFHNKFFRLVLRPINAKQMQRINDGPNYLSGNYPMGLLKSKHEKRRYLDPNAKRFSALREFPTSNNESKSDQEDEMIYSSNRQSALIKRPLFVNSLAAKTSIESTPLHTYIPVLVVTGKKAIDNRAVIRNRAKTKLLHAFQEVLKLTQEESKISDIKWPLTDQTGNPLALIFYPSKSIIDEPMQSLIEHFLKTTETIFTRYKQDPTFSNSHTNLSNKRKPKIMHRDRKIVK